MISRQQFNTIQRGDVVLFWQRGEPVNLTVEDVATVRGHGERLVTAITFDDGTCVTLEDNAGFLMSATLVQEGK